MRRVLCAAAVSLSAVASVWQHGGGSVIPLPPPGQPSFHQAEPGAEIHGGKGQEQHVGAPPLGQAATGLGLLSSSHTTRLDAAWANKAWPNTSAYYYHIHIPKCGGTTVSNMMVSAFCTTGTEPLPTGTLEWQENCHLAECEARPISTEVSCASERSVEHEFIDEAELHAMKFIDTAFAGKIEKPRVIFVTTLRSGAGRSISAWAFCSKLKWTDVGFCGNFKPGGEEMSNTSLLDWATRYDTIPCMAKFDPRNLAALTVPCYFRANNAQVAQIASVHTHDVEINSTHVEKAKAIIERDDWVVGISECLPAFFKKLGALAGVEITDAHARAIPELAHKDYSDDFNEEVLDVVRKANAADEELYQWAITRFGLSGEACNCNSTDGSCHTM